MVAPFFVDIVLFFFIFLIMSYPVQTLLKPTEERGLADVPIFMPDELGEALSKIFSFDMGGCAELEGGNIFRALQNFGQAVVDKDVCQIRFWTDDFGDDNNTAIYALAPMKKAKDVIAFIEDQISKKPKIDTVNTLRMRDVFLGEVAQADDIVGWFDLGMPSFVFKDHGDFLNLRAFFDIFDFPNFPSIDRFMNYAPSVGDDKKNALPLMKDLANAWDKPVSCEWGNEILLIEPDNHLSF